MMPFSFAYTRIILIFVVVISSTAQANNEVTKCQLSKQSPMLMNELLPSMKDKHFRQLGSAKFSVLFWDIYQSTLLTTDGQPPFSNRCQRALFEIQYLRDISKEELLENTISQWRHLALNESDYIEFVPLLGGIWPDIKAGDQLSMLSQAGTTVFYLNRQSIGAIDSAGFAKLFLSIWLDENTSEPKLRQQLLGEKI